MDSSGIGAQHFFLFLKIDVITRHIGLLLHSSSSGKKNEISVIFYFRQAFIIVQQKKRCLGKLLLVSLLSVVLSPSLVFC
jgi:hypothetical protein